MNEVVIKAKLETKDFDREIETLTDKLEGLEAEYDTIKNRKPFEGQQKILQDISKEILKTKKNLNQLVIEKEKFEKSNLTKFENSLGGASKSIDGIISKVGKLALAVFSVRSAYSFVRSSVSTLSQYNEKMANDIENIRYAIASTLQPVIERIIEMVYKLLQYINYIANAWFGKNIFENANKNLKSASKNAKELKNILSSFDEINILSSNKTIDSANTGVGVDLSKQLTNQEVPKWLQWIADHKDLIKHVTEDLLILFGAVTVGKVLKNIASLMGTSGSVGLIGLKEILAVIGTTYLVTIAIKGVKEAKAQLEELNNQLDGVTNQMKLNKNTTKDLIEKYQELISTGEITTEQMNDFKNMLNDGVESGLNMINSLEKQKTWLGALTGQNQKLTEQQEIQREKIKDLLNAYSDLYNQGKLNEDEQKTYKNLLEKTMDALADQGVEVQNLKKDYEKLTGKDYTITIKAKADTAQANKDYSNFFSKLGESVGVVLNPTEWGSGFGNKLKSIWTGKKYAKGGIINLPGSGVPITSGIGGERGYEGIVPLTDTAQMELLGESIGKHVTINATIPVYAYNRQVDKQIREIKAEDDFAYNR